MSFHYTSGRGLGDDDSDSSSPNLTQIGSDIANIFKFGTSNLPVSTQIEGSVASALAAAGSIPSPATPFLEAGAAIASLLAQFGVGSGCGQSCVLSTQYANAAESALQQNIAAYFAIPAPRWTGYQTQALQNFQTVWNDLQQQCSNPALGSAGQRCITDRESGACTWHQTTTPPWGDPAQGACWNWWNGYHDPIANDPNTTDEPPSSYSPASSALTNVESSLTSAASGIPSIVWIAAAAVVIGLVVTK